MEGLMKADPGLNRRFPQGNRLLLPNYTPSEVCLIAEGVAKRRFGLTLDTELLQRLPGFVAARHGSIEEGGDGQLAQSNGGLAVNLVEQALTHLAVRVVEQDLEDEVATVLAAVDFGMAAKVEAAEAYHQALHQPLQPTPGMLIATPTATKTNGAKLGSGGPAQEDGGVGQANDWASSGSHPRERKQPTNHSPPSSNAAKSPPPPRVPTRTRTRRAPPMANISRDNDAPPKDLYQPPSTEGNKGGQKTTEEGSSDGDVAAEVQERLRNMGVCPQAYEWDRRSCLEKSCMKCNKNAGGYGYQCKGKGHWICDDCVSGGDVLDCFD
jgi:hypothetical protein